MGRSVLVVVAHPDDEVLGCGGTMALHTERGDQVHILILAEGVASRHDRRDELVLRAIEVLKASAGNAARILGARPPVFWGMPDNRMDTVPFLDVVKAVEQMIQKKMPECIYTHHAGDLNIDHRITYRAVITAARPIPGMHVKSIYAFETPSSTEYAYCLDPAFRPTRFVDIRMVVEKKRRALEAYTSEMRPFPHPRSKEAVGNLSRFRGSSAGLEAAEAFMVIRQVVCSPIETK